MVISRKRFSKEEKRGVLTIAYMPLKIGYIISRIPKKNIMMRCCVSPRLVDIKSIKSLQI